MKTFWIIVAILVVGGIWWAKGGSVSLSTPYGSSSPTPVANASKTPVAKTGQKTATPVPTPAMSYSEAVALYGNNRIQFDANCQAQPGNVVFKNGTRILLDNRSSQPRTISINNVGYSLGSYGYLAVTLSSPNLPQILKLGCNNLVNVGTIQLQANISGH